MNVAADPSAISAVSLRALGANAEICNEILSVILIKPSGFRKRILRCAPSHSHSTLLPDNKSRTTRIYSLSSVSRPHRSRPHRFHCAQYAAEPRSQVWRRFLNLLELTCLDFDQIAFTNLAKCYLTPGDKSYSPANLVLFEEVPAANGGESMLHEEGAPSPTPCDGSNALSVASSDSAGYAAAAWFARVAEARLEAPRSTRQ
jgi:hypothetical protein